MNSKKDFKIQRISLEYFNTISNYLNEKSFEKLNKEKGDFILGAFQRNEFLGVLKANFLEKSDSISKELEVFNTKRKIYKKKALIEIIEVFDAHKNKGVGSELLNKVETLFFNEDVEYLIVPVLESCDFDNSKEQKFMFKKGYNSFDVIDKKRKSVLNKDTDYDILLYSKRLIQ